MIQKLFNLIWKTLLHNVNTLFFNFKNAPNFKYDLGDLSCHQFLSIKNLWNYTSISIRLQKYCYWVNSIHSLFPYHHTDSLLLLIMKNKNAFYFNFKTAPNFKYDLDDLSCYQFISIKNLWNCTSISISFKKILLLSKLNPLTFFLPSHWLMTFTYNDFLIEGWEKITLCWNIKNDTLDNFLIS